MIQSTGDAGVSHHERADGPIFTYYIPKLFISGSVTIGASTAKVVPDVSLAFYERTFGGSDFTEAKDGGGSGKEHHVWVYVHECMHGAMSSVKCD